MNTFLPLVPILLANSNTESMHIKPRFTMLVGIPGSGKSTFAESMIDYNTKHITSDGIRKELYGDENCQDDHNRVFSLMQERTLDALKNGYNVVYDATNITRKNRKSILDRLPAYVTKECVIVWAPIDVCIERDSVRERTVGKAVIEKMLRRFEAPFYDEGFDYITVQNTAEYDKDEYTINTVEAINIPNDNPHHTSASILEHCFLCGKNLLNEGNPNVVICAGFIHDIGKAFTKNFVNTKGETTDIAHYYDHQAVGSWISYGIEHGDPVLAWLISSHMAPFINKKYYDSLDPLYKKWLDALHRADKAAH